MSFQLKMYLIVKVLNADVLLQKRLNVNFELLTYSDYLQKSLFCDIKIKRKY